MIGPQASHCSFRHKPRQGILYNAHMDLLNRLSLAIRAAANVVIGEVAVAPEDQAAHLLKTAQQRANKLNEQLAQAVAREQRAEQDWREARARADALEAEVDTAVRNHQDEVARARLPVLNQAQTTLLQLNARWKAYAAASEKLRIEIQDLQAQLTEAQRRLQQANEHRGNASGLQAPQQPQRDQRKETAQGQNELEARERQAAHIADDASPRNELDETRIADLLKKHDKEP
jgi:phage shock protein A